MYRKSSYHKEKKAIEEIIHKCSFCKTAEAVGEFGSLYYCSNNICATEL